MIGTLYSCFLNMGEMLFSSQACRVKTVLGSCVGVALFDIQLRVGGLCHYLLPTAGAASPSTKYGDVALPALIKKFIDYGSHLTDLRAWVARWFHNDGQQ